MCCILAAQDSKPDLDLIQKIHAKNNDLIGVVWFDNEGIPTYKKGLYPTQANDLIKTLELPFVMHFRKASFGMDKSNLLCHPFEVSEKSPLALEGKANQLLVHNGTIAYYKVLMAAANLKPIDYPLISDSRVLAIILSRLENIQNQKDFLKQFFDKFILIDRESNLFRTFGKFEDDIKYPGMIFSNLEWKWYSVSTGFPVANTGLSYMDEYVEDEDKKKIGQACGNANIVKVNFSPEDSLNQIFDAPESSPLYNLMSAEDRLAYKAHLLHEAAQRCEKHPNKIPCFICGTPLDKGRIDTLKSLHRPEKEMQCIYCATLYRPNDIPMPIKSNNAPPTSVENYAG